MAQQDRNAAEGPVGPSAMAVFLRSSALRPEPAAFWFRSPLLEEMTFTQAQVSSRFS